MMQYSVRHIKVGYMYTSTVKNITISFNEAEYQQLTRQCEKLKVSRYRYVKKATQEYIKQNSETLPEKINRLLWEEH